MRANAFGSAPAAAIESDVREPGRIVVCAEEIPEMITATISSLPAVSPRTALPAIASTRALSSNCSTRPRPR